MKKFIFLILMIAMLAISSTAQTTEFTYQGQLQNSSTPATGVFDFEFALFDANSGGGQIGSTNTRTGISVSSGIFSVNLDFGQSFPGASRFLEIRVRQLGGGAFTTLSPRQPVASAPYSIKSLNADTAQTAATATNATNAVNSTNAVNATNAATATSFTGPLAGDVTGTQASTIVARLRGTNVASAAPTDGQVLKYNAATAQWRPDTDNTGAGGGGTITGVTASTGLTGGGVTGAVTLGIATGGVGTAQIADNSVTDPKINTVSGAKVTGAVATATNSTQLGGVAANQYVQTNDSRLTDARTPTAGSTNYVQNGTSAQAASNFNISGNGTAGGTLSGNIVNATTQYNIGANRILSNNPGANNLFAGVNAGAVTTGGGNSFFGAFAGSSNMIGTNNTAIGFGADVGAGNLLYATALGSGSIASQSNSIFLGRPGGPDKVRIPGDIAITGYVGIGSSIVPSTKLHVFGGTDAAPGSGGYIVAGATDSTNVVIDDNEIMARNNFATATFAINAAGGNVNLIQGGTGNVGIGTSAPADKLDVDGDIRVGTSGTNGCLKNNNGGTITGTCSSDIRFKRGITPFSNMLDKVAGLRPVNYYWRATEFPAKGFGNAQDYGLIAQDVEQLLPELVSEDAQGYKQIDYSKLPLMTIQAVRELKAKTEVQQAMIETQQKQLQQQESDIDRLKAQVEILKSVVCSDKSSLAVCKPKEK